MKRRFSLFTYPVMDMKAAEAELNRRAAAGWLCSCRTLLGRTLRTGRIPLIAEQLIKVLKVIRHGSVSLSTWNSSLPPTRRRNPHAPRGIR